MLRCARSILARSRAYSTTTLAVGAKPRVIFSGIQPTGIPHLGNYLGALLNWVKLQNTAKPEDELFFTIVGWHALTLPQDPKALRAARRDMLAVLLAIGIDPKRSTIFQQESNQDHTELAWILNCITPVGKLRRMTTWKAKLADSRGANDESEVDESMLNAGLFTYPVLQAADILLYRATHVPVGDDQRQHLELSCEIADTFNHRFKRLLGSPQTLITPSRRIKSLQDPSTKMSKSAPDTKSRILLTDTPAQIHSKIKASVTDSLGDITYDPVNRPGTSNLLTILAACADEDVESVALRYANKQHGPLKTDVAAAVEELFRSPREEFLRIREDIGYLEEVARVGAEKAKERSGKTMREIRKRLGLA